MQQIFPCPRCGASNYWGQPYCQGCGAPLTSACPRCGASMPASSGFCTNCGAQFGFGQQPAGQRATQPARPRKPTSGWAIFGGALFVIGVLCIIAGPVFVMLKPEAEQNTSDIIKWVAAGGVGLIIGLPLFFKG